MTTPDQNADVGTPPPPMTPERWRAVDAILRAALECEPAGRDAFVADACAGDEPLQREVASLLAAHDRAGDEFLERPAAEALDARGSTTPLTERLAKSLAGRYEIERELGRGGMATVYLARDLAHDRRVAIKVLREELAAAVGAERFLAEIRVTASLQHPHIVPLFDSGSTDGGRLLWYIMPFVEGETLRARLDRDGRLPVDVAVQLVREMAGALEYAHASGVVHRDVKPENVLLQDGHALVADFGIALALEHAGGTRLTRTGIMLGTPQYMSPEQAAGERAIDARTDVYALGVVLHEMLAGESPFAAPSPQAVLQRVLHVSPIALSRRRAEVSSSLDAAVLRAMEKQPNDRFPSAAAFAAALTVSQPGDKEAAPGASDSKPLAGARDARTGGEHAVRSRGRKVSARAAIYAAGAMVAVGLVGGWALARSPLVQRGTSAASDPGPRPWVDPAAGAAWGLVKKEGDGISLAVVDRTGRAQRTIAANRPWTPRISPDGRSVAYGAFGDGRGTSDVWVTDLGTGTTRRLTDDDTDSNDPQWSADGATVAYSANAPGGKDLLAQRIDGGAVRGLATRPGTQFPTDWLRDGTALLVSEQAGANGFDILVQPADGSKPWPYAATRANETAARVSRDGRWVAYTSDETGRAEVYLDSYPRPGRRVRVSWSGGQHPVWRGDGRELYYWNDGALMAVKLGATAGDAAPAIEEQKVLFRAPYHPGQNTMYDVWPDGQRFVIVQQP